MTNQIKKESDFYYNFLILLVPPARLERTAPRLGIWCSIHLSYGGVTCLLFIMRVNVKYF